ncbi:MFS transporter [uncultured Methanoregula sp.]|uniref:MFS transporter n=1 Tax=uncultured Methanoregula sp. TaxID=1005933 RepID=UPI002AAA6656|nr:MFS transporter [uncultured Methanoregula sp.]
MHEDSEKRVLLIVASLASFLVPYTVSSLNVALPAISTSFGIDAVMLGWVTSAYMLTAAICIVPFGKLADLYGRKRFFILGNVLFAAGSLLAAVSWSGTVIIAARVIQGLGGAMVFSTSIAIVTSVFPPGERGRAIGIITATVYAGLSLGPFIGGVLTYNIGWPSIFLVNIPLAILVILLTMRYIPGEWADSGKKRFDLAGAGLYGVMLFGCIYGLTLLPSRSGILWMLLGLVVLALFIWWEQREPAPMVEIALFRKSPVFLFSNIAALINYAVVFAVAFLMSLYLQYNRGIDPQTTGLILIAQPVVQMIVSPAAGHLSDRIEPRILATAGMALTTVGLGIMMLLSPTTPLAVIIAGLAILGLGYGLFSSPNTNAIMSSVDVRYLGLASGMVSTMRAIGQMLSLAIAMLVFSAVIGTVQISPEFYPQLQQSVNIAFGVFFILGLVGIAASYARGTVREAR